MSNNFPVGVALWTDKNRKFKYVLNEPIVVNFRKDRTQYIAHTQTEIF